MRGGRRLFELNPKPLVVERVIEVGNIFKLGTKYSTTLGATYLDEQGQARPIVMGSYGIGPARIVASAIDRASKKMQSCGHAKGAVSFASTRQRWTRPSTRSGRPPSSC